METFRHCQLQENKTILGSRHVVLQGHCSGRIAVRIGFVVAAKIDRASVNISTLLTLLEDFKSTVFIPDLQRALRHEEAELQLEHLVAIKREARAVSDVAAVGRLQHGVNSPVDVCTLSSAKHNVFVRVEVYTGLRCSVLHWLQDSLEQRRTRCSLPPDPVRLVSFLLTYVMDLRSLEEAGAGHPDPHAGNIVLRRRGKYVWTDLGSSQSMLVTNRVHVFQQYMIDMVSLASHVVRHPTAREVLVAFSSAARQTTSTPLQLCRNVLASSLAALQQGRADFNDEVIKEVGVAIFRDDLSNLKARIDRMSQGSESSVVWVRELIRKELEPVGNGFQVKGTLANVDDLKKAIDPSMSPLQASKIQIFSREDGEWKQEEEDAEVNRGATKPDSYGFVLPDVS
ncbi:HERC1, partial [Symbiodinium sp. CCMP2456]